MLHMVPSQLEEKLDQEIDQNRDKNIILIFGDCHARMNNYESNPNIQRIQGINCCEILLGDEKYRKMRKQGAFILLPEWAERWKEAFVEHLGFSDEELAKEFMREMHNKIIYIDNGLYKIEDSVLEEIVQFTGLPLEIHEENNIQFGELIKQKLGSKHDRDG